MLQVKGASQWSLSFVERSSATRMTGFFLSLCSVITFSHLSHVCLAPRHLSGRGNKQTVIVEIAI